MSYIQKRTAVDCFQKKKTASRHLPYTLFFWGYLPVHLEHKLRIVHCLNKP